MTTKIAGALALGSLMVGLALGRYSLPAKVITKYEKAAVRSDHSVVTRTQEKKTDGTLVTVTQIHRNVESETHQSSEKDVTRDSARWLVSGIIGSEFIPNSLPQFPMYGLNVNYRILGPLYIGADLIKLSPGAFAGLSLGVAF